MARVTYTAVLQLLAVFLISHAFTHSLGHWGGGDIMRLECVRDGTHSWVLALNIRWSCSKPKMCNLRRSLDLQKWTKKALLLYIALIRHVHD